MVPLALVKEVYQLSNQLPKEEKYGLTRRSLMVYKAMCRKVPAEEQLEASESQTEAS